MRGLTHTVVTSKRAIIKGAWSSPNETSPQSEKRPLTDLWIGLMNPKKMLDNWAVIIHNDR
jgi:hypothetical protein